MLHCVGDSYPTGYYFLIEQAEKWSASDLREKAIAMIGEREYLRRKIAKGYKLWKLDKELLDEILRK